METVVSVIVTHNTRLQCLIDFIRNETTPKIRFMNCVIFKLVITDEELELSMIYSGELEHGEQRKISLTRPYYVKDLEDCYPRHEEGAESDVEWIGQKPTIVDDDEAEWIGPKPSGIKPCNVYTPYTTRDFKTRLKLPSKITKKLVFFFVRHGQALHNASNTYGMTLDTPLTPLGNRQALRAGSALKKYIDRDHPSVSPDKYYFFVSDLLRTRQTCINVLAKVIPGDRYNSNFVVLPCSHEINTKGNDRGNCDQTASTSSLYKKVARENYSSCTVNSDGTLNPICDAKHNDWSYYLDFYGNKIRGEQNYASNYVKSFFTPQAESKQCRNTNMVAEAIQIIEKKMKGGKKSKKHRYHKRNTKKLK